MFWSCESLTCLPLSLRAMFSTMLEFLYLCEFAGAVAPDSFSETITTSFIGRKLNFYRVFCSFQGCYLLFLDFYGF